MTLTDTGVRAKKDIATLPPWETGKTRRNIYVTLGQRVRYQ